MKTLCSLLFLCSLATLAIAQPEIKTKVQTPWSEVSAPPAKPSPSKAPALLQSEKEELERFWVQVGAFTSDDNAQRLKARLRKAKFPALIHITKDVDRRVWYHVLIGDYKSQQKAEVQAEDYMLKYNTKAIVLDQGKSLRVFQPEADLVLNPKKPKVYGPPGVKDPELIEPPDTIFTPKVPPKQKFTFQVGGLYKLKAARTLAKRLKKKGYRPSVLKRRDRHDIEWWYTVEIGYFYTKTQAEYAASDFFEKENIQAVVPTRK